MQDGWWRPERRPIHFSGRHARAIAALWHQRCWGCFHIASHSHSAGPPHFPCCCPVGFSSRPATISTGTSPCEGWSTQWLRLGNKELSPQHSRRRRRYGNTSAQTTSRDWRKLKRTRPEEMMEKCTQRNGLQLNCALWSYPQNCTTSCPQRFLPLGIIVSSGNYKACVFSCWLTGKSANSTISTALNCPPVFERTRHRATLSFLSCSGNR